MYLHSQGRAACQTIGWDTKWKGDELIIHYLQVCTSRSAYQTAAATQDDDNKNDNDTDYQQKKQLLSPPATTITKHQRPTQSIIQSMNSKL